MKIDILDTLCLAQVEAALMNTNDEVMQDINGFVSFDYVMRLVESHLRAEMESSLLMSLDEVKKRRASLAGQCAPAGFNPETATPPWAQPKEPKKQTRKLSNNARI
ncbi:TPA: hypothetical protein L6A15_09555 [Pseudomonas aeruginosa]|uniref:hypothetical protein n=1 Tax=Pseudomonas aeruginosa TaxID=287 RepID=UPI00053EC26B|nr:hypothetical protein [Pseudomonas aeruginosa]EMB0048708.1 hypothetical protein [Pseudomonas aeruginosa]MBX6065874.1 hypothetical protein [Pseudomonas aeruginosa]MBX6241642.1 hypothetical protein [Pseudomonas aeruginosa]MCG3058068.1 hypothetical protein [Pseudomonas aeruginosa]MCG3071557.1 hypothetical protein [Pseudomonas aeruginosa]